MANDNEIIDNIANKEYEFGFVTDIEMDIAPAGLNEDTIRYISAKKNEPEWLLDWRLKGLQSFWKQKLPEWQNFVLPAIDFQKISYYAAPKSKKKYDSLDQVDPELLATFEKLGIPLSEQKTLAGVAVDVVFDSVSVTTTYK
jgi:Fe-S cluster assembly protein SufB